MDTTPDLHAEAPNGGAPTVVADAIARRDADRSARGSKHGSDSDAARTARAEREASRF